MPFELFGTPMWRLLYRERLPHRLFCCSCLDGSCQTRREVNKHTDTHVDDIMPVTMSMSEVDVDPDTH